MLVALGGERRLFIIDKGALALEVLLGCLVGTGGVGNGTLCQQDNLGALIGAYLDAYHVVEHTEFLVAQQVGICVPCGITVLTLGLAPLVEPPVVVELSLGGRRMDGGVRRGSPPR